MSRHKVKKTYMERAATGVDVHVLECMCGWKEKAYETKEVIARFNRHVERPHKV